MVTCCSSQVKALAFLSQSHGGMGWVLERAQIHYGLITNWLILNEVVEKLQLTYFLSKNWCNLFHFISSVFLCVFNSSVSFNLNEMQYEEDR